MKFSVSILAQVSNASRPPTATKALSTCVQVCLRDMLASLLTRSSIGVDAWCSARAVDGEEKCRGRMNGAHSRMLTGVQVVACFFGEWHPGSVRRVAGEMVQVLWEEEYSVSWFPVSDVRLAPLNPGDRVHALFHGSWFPAVLQHIAKDGVQVLWEGENTASCLPACDVVRLADEDAFNLTGKPQQDEGIAASGAGEDCVASDSGAVALDRGCFRDQNEALHKTLNALEF